MGVGFRGAGLVSALTLVLSLGCGLETSGIGGSDVGVEVVDDQGGDWVPEEDVGREDPGGTDDTEGLDDVVDPVDDAEDRPDVVDDAGEEDDAPLPDGCVVEVCNGADDDCDGRPDDGFECAIGTFNICGPCGEGRQSCADGCVWSECSYPAEVCAAGTVEACTPAACEAGHRTCESSCRWTECVADHSECAPGAVQSCSVDPCGSGSQTCRTDCSWGGCHVECERDWEDCCPGAGCVNLDSDPNNCGSCGNDCGDMTPCSFGDCWW
jgi:hypothetical protein